MNYELLKPEVQHFIISHINDDINKILLGKSPFPGISTRELVQQIDGKKRIEKKLPNWFNTPGIYFPQKLNIEQSSSELTAAYKSKLIQGDSLIDLTGGFGVDVTYFSKYAGQVYHIEQNEELSNIAAHNSKILGISNIEFIKANSIEFLQEAKDNFSTLYVDPARRIESQKVFLLKDTLPDVVSNLPLFLSKAERVIIKTSPLFDIQSGLRELAHVSEIHVVSIKNDCKELLWVIDRNFEGEPIIIASCLNQDTEERFSFKLSEEKDLPQAETAAPEQYLYEPDVALLKAGGFKSIGSRFELKKLNPNTHLYTSESFSNKFPGKVFRIREVAMYKEWIKARQRKKANIVSRNFPLSPDQIKKKHKLTDGGDDFLFFCTGNKNQLLVIDAQKVTQ